MDNFLSFTVQDLLLVILWALIVFVLIKIVQILSRSLGILKNLERIVKDNKPHVDHTMESIPSLTKNMDEIASEVSRDIRLFRDTFENVSSTSGKVTAKLNENSDFISSVGSFVHTVAVGKALYDKYFASKVEDKMAGIKEVLKDVSDTIEEMDEKKK